MDLIDIQKLRCRVNFSALRFTPQIEELSRKVINFLKQNGPFLVIVNHEVLPCFINLLANNYKKSIKKEACWTLSNITAGNTQQIQAVIDANIIPPLVALFQNVEFDIKKEVAWAIFNATSDGSPEQLNYG
ncbi:hypothetical protein RYX36_011500 [Vicia faba]